MAARSTTCMANASPSFIRRISWARWWSWRKNVHNNQGGHGGPLALVLTAALPALALPSYGATSSEAVYPVRPIRMLVPFAPGGATDIVARVLESNLSRRVGQQVVIDNRSGAAGNIAVELVAQSQPDG